jgi:hypothetical protein
VHVVYKGNNRILRERKFEISEFFCEMLTSLQYKCVNKQTHQVRVRSVFKVREVRGLGLGRPKNSGVVYWYLVKTLAS